MTSNPRQHLYVILDDWESGFSIRKFDLDTDDQLIPRRLKSREAGTCLPPPFISFRAQRKFPTYFSGAFGSKILAMHPKEENSPDRGGFCFDVHEQSLNCIRRHTDQLRPVYFPIGNKLFALGYLSLELLDLQSLVSPSSQLDGGWCKLDDSTPVDSMFVVSGAVLPDRHTIFVSVDGMTGAATYSLTIPEDGSYKWKHHGEWMLPFDGCGYLDQELNTWVGLALYGEEPGRICSCELPSVNSEGRPDVKYSQEYLFTEDPAEKHVGSTLVYMGHQSKFCLVECVKVGNKDDDCPSNFGQEYVVYEHVDMFLRLTTFSLKLENGVLTTGNSQLVQYYKVPNKEVNELFFLSPQAFWL